MSQEGGVLKINIYGTEYPIKSDSNADTEYILKVADYVDQKMREIDQNTQSKSSLKIAILAALNIADELFQEKQKEIVKVDNEKTGARIKYLFETLDKALASDT